MSVPAYSRRYVCHCGAKGRCSPARRGSTVKCSACKQYTPARLLSETVALDASRQGVKLRCSPMEMLVASLKFDSNLLLWRSPDGVKKPRFFVWSTRLGDGPANTDSPTLEGAIEKFYRNYVHQTHLRKQGHKETPDLSIRGSDRPCYSCEKAP